MLLIDTNIHAAYLLQEFEDDNLTKQYLALYDTIILSERVIPEFILGEFETFMMQVVPSRYKLNATDKQQLQQLSLDYIYLLTNECTVVTPNVSSVKRARDLYFENAKTHYLSFIDCLLLATAEYHNYTLFTKDKRMKAIAQQLHIPLLTP